jgi:hypothetical protein
MDESLEPLASGLIRIKRLKLIGLTPSGLYLDRGPVPLNSSRTSFSFLVESETNRNW